MEALGLLFDVLRVCRVTLVLLGIAAFRFPVRSGLLAGFAALCVGLGFHAAVSVVLYGVLLPPVLWWGAGRLLKRTGRSAVLEAYQRVIGRWLYEAFRRWWLYERRWQRTLAKLGLTDVIPNAYDEVPKLKRVTPTAIGDSLRVEILPGQSIEEWEGLASTGALHKAFSTRRQIARQCRVYDEPGRLIRMELAYGPSPLEQPILHPGVPALGDIDLTAVPVGITEHGDVFSIPVLGSSLVVAGIMGAGKSSALWSLILGLAPMVKEGTVRLWGYDGKGGMELRWCRDLFGDRYCEGDLHEAADMLGLYREALIRRTNMLGGVDRALVPSRSMPVEVLFIDEFARLTGKTGDRELDRKLDMLLRDIINMGRAPGFPLLGFLQNPTQETLRHRNEIANAFALRLKGQGRADLILGPGAERMGARCDLIPTSLPGVGYAMLEGLREPVAFRLFKVTDEMLRDCHKRFAPPAEPDRLAA